MKFLSTLAITLLIAQAPIAIAQDQQANQHRPRITMAKPAPVQLGQLQLALLDGKVFDARTALGKYVVINFWATWCAPCLKEMPDFQKLADQRKDILLIGLAYEDSTDADLIAFLKKKKISYLNGKVDVYSSLPAPLETPKGLPLTMVFDRQGLLLKKFLGPITQKDLLAVIDAKTSTNATKN